MKSYDDFTELLIKKSEEENSDFDPSKANSVQQKLSLKLALSQHITYWITENQDKFKEFMDELLNASLYVEEGKQVRIRIAIALPEYSPDIKFSSPLNFNAKRLAKIAPSIDLWDRHLFIKPDDDGELQIFGFKQRPYSGWDSKSYGSSSSWFLSIEIHGAGKIIANYPCSCQYNKGEISEFSDFYSVEVMDKWFIHIALMIDKWKEKPTYNDTSIVINSSEGLKGAHFFKPILHKILKYMIEGKHGGCIAIVPQDRKIWKSSIELKDYELKSKYLIEVMEKRFKASPVCGYMLDLHYGNPTHILDAALKQDKELDDIAKEVDNLHFAERELEQAVRFISSLSYIDGAVVLSKDLEILGFGARFTASPAQNPNINNVGMRHKSAHDFCCNIKDSIAIVVSQDGGITVFSNNGEGTCNQDKVTLDYLRTDN